MFEWCYFFIIKSLGKLNSESSSRSRQTSILSVYRSTYKLATKEILTSTAKIEPTTLHLSQLFFNWDNLCWQLIRFLKHWLPCLLILGCQTAELIPVLNGLIVMLFVHIIQSQRLYTYTDRFLRCNYYLFDF